MALEPAEKLLLWRGVFEHEDQAALAALLLVCLDHTDVSRYEERCKRGVDGVEYRGESNVASGDED